MIYASILFTLFPIYVLNACITSCATCINPNNWAGKTRCTSCYSSYFLNNYACYSCSLCDEYDSCSLCPTTTSSSTTSTSTSIYSIIFGVAGGVFFICILIVCIYRCRKLRAARELSAEVEGVEGSNSSLGFGEWTANEKSINSGQNCAICLDGSVSVMTKCRHLYHPKCILEWCKREVSCPLCKSRALQPLKYFCPQCSISSIEVSVGQIAKMLVGGQMGSCDGCRKPIEI